MILGQIPARRMMQLSLLWMVGVSVSWCSMGAAEEAAPAAAKEAVWNTLPESTWMLISLPDVQHARQAFQSGKLSTLSQLPGIQEFVGDVQGFYRKNMDEAIVGGGLAPWLKTLHLDPKTLLDTPQGEVTLGIVSIAPREQRFDIVLRFGLAKQEQATGLSDLLDQMLAMRPELPVQKREMKFGDQKAYALEVPEANLAAYFSTDESAVAIGTEPDRFGLMLAHKSLALDKETAIKDSALGKALVKALKGTPDFLVYFNLAAIVPEQLDDPGQQRALAGAARLGIRKVAYALRFDETTGGVLETVLIDYNPDIWKTEAAVAQPVNLDQFEHGPGGTIAQVSVNLNWAQTWNALNSFMRQGPNAAEGDRIVKGLEEFLGAKIPDFLGCLDGQVTANVALPRTETGFVANVIPDGMLKLGLADAEKTAAAVGKFHDWIAANDGNKAFAPEKYEVEGAKAAWIYSGPGRHNRLRPVLIVEEKNLYFAPMAQMAANARRATPYGPQLAERKDWQQLKAAVPNNAFLVGYVDLATAAELGYNFGTYVATMEPNNPFAKYRLPAGDQIGKVFTGWLITAHAEENVLVVQSQSPVGLLPGFAATAFLAKYFEVSEKTQRLLVRRDMAAKRQAALYNALSQFNATNKKLPEKLSELYPEHLKNIADFTVGDSAWSMNPQGNGERLRALIDDRTEFVMVPAHFGAADKTFLVPKQSALDSEQGMPAMNGDGKAVMLTAADYTALLNQVPEAASGNNDPKRGWRGRGGDRGPGGPGGDRGPKPEPAPLPPAPNNPDDGF